MKIMVYTLANLEKKKTNTKNTAALCKKTFDASYFGDATTIESNNYLNPNFSVVKLFRRRTHISLAHELGF